MFTNSLCGSAITTAANNVDILPVLKHALRTAKENPRLALGQTPLVGTLDEIFKNYRLVTINMGWENSSLFSGEIALKSLSLVEEQLPPQVTVSAWPTNLVAVPYFSTTQLTWTSTNATSCVLESTANGTTRTINGSAPVSGGHAAGFASVTANTTATYSVRCTGPGGNRTASASVIWRPASALGTPTGLALSSATSTALVIRWNPVAGATRYYLDVSRDPTFATTLTGYRDRDVSSATSFSVGGLSSSVTYHYRVRASNGTTFGAFTLAGSGTTAAGP